MRLRVLGVLGSVLVGIALILCAVLMQTLARNATQDLQLSRLASLERFVQLAAHTDTNAERTLLAQEMRTYTELYDEALVIQVDGQRLSSGSVDVHSGPVAEVLAAAQVNLGRTEIPVLSPFSTAEAYVARPFGYSSQVLGAVLLEVNQDAARARLGGQWAVLVLITLSVCAGLMLIADRLSFWVLRPVHRLNLAVAALQRDDAPADLPQDGPPELRELSRSFSDMARTLTSSLKQQRELIAETSHQLRNPVAALRLRVDLLKLRLDGKDVAAVEQELHRVETLLEAVLRLASAEHRLTESASTQQRDPVQAAQVLREEYERQAALGRSVKLMQPLPEAVIRCSEFELQQMLAELVDNALKYGAAPIELALRAEEDSVLLTVRDHGPGMDAAAREQAVQSFWRAENTGQGTGLGLAIVDRLARANSGRLQLSNADGGGLAAVLRFGRWTEC